MSVKHVLVLALALAGCRDHTPLASKVTGGATAAAASSTTAKQAVAIRQAAPAVPKLPPPPPEQRARVMITAPAVRNCEGVKVRVYADGVRRSCMTASQLKPGENAQVVVNCGLSAELPAERPVKLELRYERAGVTIAQLGLGDPTLDIGDQALSAPPLRAVSCPTPG
jgi:hypothetical protein